MRKNILIGGQAGQRSYKISKAISNAFLKEGFYVFNAKDYQSLIRGGHNFNMVCFSDKETNSYDEQMDVIIALDENTYSIHKNQLKTDGAVITISPQLKEKLAAENKECYLLEPEKFLGKKISEKKSEEEHFDTEKKILIDYLFKKLQIDVKENQDRNNQINKNQAGDSEIKGNFAKENISKTNGDNNNNDFLIGNSQKILTGAEAMAKAAVDSKLQIYFGYPMTPATPVHTFLAGEQHPNNLNSELFVFTPENEIAAINAAIGASFAGKRAMVGTSGGGYDLMTEALSLQGMMELPLTVHLSQRSGPATGVPTYTAQADLNVALYGGHGEFLRIVAAPGDADEVYQKTAEAMYLTEKTKILAIILTDKHLIESDYTCKLNKTNLIMPLRTEFAGKGLFKRNSYEHDPHGNTTENPAEIKASVEQREHKKVLLAKEMEKLIKYKITGNEKGENLLISFGSTKGAIDDALPELPEWKHLHLIYLEPFPTEIITYLNSAKKIMVVENNSTGPLARWITANTGMMFTKEQKILKYDGRPFTPQEIIEKVR